MGNIKFLRNPKSRKKRKWQCSKKIQLRVETPGKVIISKTRKNTRKTRDKLDRMDSTTKRKILENQGLLRADSNAPQDVVDIMLKNLC